MNLQETVTVPLKEGMEKLDQKLDQKDKRERQNADEFRDNARRFTAAQDITNQRLEHIENTLGDIRKDTGEMAAAIAAVVEKLTPK